jgi:hypothetical protein
MFLSPFVLRPKPYQKAINSSSISIMKVKYELIEAEASYSQINV